MQTWEANERGDRDRRGLCGGVFAIESDDGTRTAAAAAPRTTGSMPLDLPERSSTPPLAPSSLPFAFPISSVSFFFSSQRDPQRKQKLGEKKKKKFVLVIERSRWFKVHWFSVYLRRLTLRRTWSTASAGKRLLWSKVFLFFFRLQTNYFNG